MRPHPCGINRLVLSLQRSQKTFLGETLDICWYQHVEKHELCLHAILRSNRQIAEHHWFQSERATLKGRNPIHAALQYNTFQRGGWSADKFMPRLSIIHVRYYFVVARVLPSVFVFQHFSKKGNAQKCHQSFTQWEEKNFLQNTKVTVQIKQQ